MGNPEQEESLIVDADPLELNDGADLVEIASLETSTASLQCTEIAYTICVMASKLMEDLRYPQAISKDRIPHALSHTPF